MAEPTKAHTSTTSVHTEASKEAADKDINQPNPLKPLKAHEEALNHFNSGRHQLINSRLRNQPYSYEDENKQVQGEVVYDDTWADRMANMIGHAILRSKELEGGEVVYKVASGSLAKAFKEAHEKERLAGLRIQDLGFLVVAKSKAAAERCFKGSPQVLVEIETAKSQKAVSDRYSLIFERGTTVQVVSSEMVKDVLHIKTKII